MGLFKQIKLYFEKKTIVKQQSEQTIPNLLQYNSEKKTIVFVNGGMPTHDKDSGSNRLKEIILAYKKEGFNCIICTKNAYRTDAYIQYYADLGIIVYVETSQYKNYFEFIKSISRVDYIWYYSPDTLKDNFKKISKIVPNAKSIFDMVDIHFLRYQRAIELEPTRISLRKKYKKYFEIETKLAKKVDYIIAISDVEKDLMKKYVADEKLITISNIHYPKIKKELTQSFEDRKDIIFIGSTHTPNIDALYYLFNEIMPLVWLKLPEIKVNIIGNVNEKINDINHPNFIFQGYVPDIVDFFKSNKIMVAPLRYGAGVKGKIGQAFEYYLPVVTSSIGAEGMKLINGKNALIEDTNDGFADAIVNLYSNETLWLELQSNSEDSLQPFSIANLKSTIKLIN
ncbi:glycosyltransferase family 4 protein [Flavobacterium sp. SUN052]|uniref:glycosyltransferase n=1 Tax=Flavobacterium sp. SUN052 TaxID=3002441 RepID=UPI00237EA8C0|nr:glycosyltransferase family 4 protein [Flavobacterium sp. SUN052]MEC4005363.1 glycosyltransferase family 4 protein [Flavobacterium sp. SUN052]